MVEVKDKERPRSTKSVQVANNNGSLVVQVVVRRELVQSLEDLVRLGLVVDADTAPDFVDGISLDGELRDDTCSLLVMCLLIDHREEPTKLATAASHGNSKLGLFSSIDVDDGAICGDDFPANDILERMLALCQRRCRFMSPSATMTKTDI